MDEDEGGADDVAGSAGAEGDVIERGPAFDEKGKAAFAEAAKGTQQGVVGTIADVQLAAVSGLLEWNEYTVTSAFVIRVGQDRHVRLPGEWPAGRGRARLG